MHLKNKYVRMLLVLIALIVAAKLIYSLMESYENDKKIPYAGRGCAFKFSAEMSKATPIKDIDSTDEYIYFAYARKGVVAVYNWNGEYQYSLVFFSDTNGSLQIRCENGLLYVCDYAGYEFVFAGDELIAVYEQNHKLHVRGWFSEATTWPVIVKNNMVYDKNGNYIMELPGKL